MNQKGISSIVIISIVVGVLAIGGGVWYWQSQKKEIKKIEEPTTQQPTTPSITVISPNGGENFLIGVVYTIQWSDTNPNMHRYIHILNEDGTENIWTNGAIGESYNWELGTPTGGTVKPGRHKIRIYDAPPGCTLKAWIGVGEGDPYATPCADSAVSFDDSDGWFTVREAVIFSGSRAGSQYNFTWSSDSGSSCALYAHRKGIYGGGLISVASNLPATGSYVVSTPIPEAQRGYYALKCVVGATTIEKSVWILQ